MSLKMKHLEETDFQILKTRLLFFFFLSHIFKALGFEKGKRNCKTVVSRGSNFSRQAV